MKYRIAKGTLKDCKIRQTANMLYVNYNNVNQIWRIHEDDLQIYLDAGIIETIPEPKWTDDDMIDIVTFAAFKETIHSKDIFEKFKQQKGIE